MSTDLRTLLDDAVVDTTLDVEAALSRGRTLRRRRAATQAVAVLTLAVTVGVGLPQALPVTRAPIVSSVPADAPHPLLVPVVDDTTGALTVELDVADLPDALPGEGVALAVRDVLAVGADGTVVARALADDAGTSGLHVQAPDGTLRQYEPDVRITAAAVAPDGTIVAVGVRGRDGVVVAVSDGGSATVDLGPDGIDLSGEQSPVQLAVVGDAVDLLVYEEDDAFGRAQLRRAPLWNPDERLIIADLSAATPSTMLFPLAAPDVPFLPDDLVVGLPDGRSLAVVVTGGDGPAGSQSRGGGAPVVDGVHVGAAILDRVDGTAVAVGLAAHPATGEALVVPMPPGPEGLLLDGVALHATTGGALWAITTDPSSGGRLHRVASTRPWAQPATATLPRAPDRPSGDLPGGAVIAPGEVAAIRTTPAPLGDGRVLYDSSIPGRPTSLLAVAPDGTAVVDGPDGLLLDAPDGDDAVAQIEVRQLWQPREGADGPGVAFDTDGNLWALADRWWSGARYPDLVVHRPGERGFASVGHVRVRHLLGVDAPDVVLHVQGDEVALVGAGIADDGTALPLRRVVVARAGDRIVDAPVQRLPGPNVIGEPSGVRTRLAVYGFDAELRGPFVPVDVVAGRPDLRTDAIPARATSLDGGIVLASPTLPSGDQLVLAGAPDGSTLAQVVPPPSSTCSRLCDDSLAAADGSIWLLRDGALVPLVDGAWRPVEPEDDAASDDGP